MLLGAVTFVSVAWPYILPVVQNRNLWAAISLVIVLLFTSGHMFNHIRKVPYVAGDGRGGMSYFAGGFSNQFGLETQIVAAMCEFWVESCSETLDSNIHRWHSFFCNHRTCAQSTTDDGRKKPTNCRDTVGKRYVFDVQFSTQCVSHQERRISVLSTAILEEIVRVQMPILRCIATIKLSITVTLERTRIFSKTYT